MSDYTAASSMRASVRRRLVLLSVIVAVTAQLVLVIYLLAVRADPGITAAAAIATAAATPGVYLLFRFYFSVIRRLETVGQKIARLAQGDFSVDIKQDRKDEIGMLLREFGNMARDLSNISGKISSSTNKLYAASREFSGASANLSRRTEEQASALEETAASMEQLSSTVKQNAANAREANRLALSAADVAAKGGEAVGRVVTTMTAINESSKKVAEISSVIDGIAFQTRILSLNAAVEAARAGEQGRGFAVVATEVRSLAQRSADAAKDIKALIAGSVEKMENGGKLANDAGRTMQDIVTGTRQVCDIMADISAASAEQSAGIEQINRAITQLDKVTQENAVLVEETAAVADTMQKSTQELYDAVVENWVEGVFQTTLEGKYLSVNPALAKMYGYESPAEMMASFSNIARQLYVDSTRRDDFKRLIHTHGMVSNFESEIYRKDGSIIWITENAREVRDASGNLLYYEGTVEDITMRKTKLIDAAPAPGVQGIAQQQYAAWKQLQRA